MRVLLTGATGFLGRALVLGLRRRGHGVVAWVRSAARARSALGDQAELVPLQGAPGELGRALERCDAVVNLAGAPVLAPLLTHWSAARRRELVASRVDGTTALVQALARATPRPRVLVSGSAVGIYGDAGAVALDEAAPPGTGFLAELCGAWEAAARGAEALGVRVVLLRTGVVLGHDGGALPAMLTPFQLGLGGRLGSGRQYLSWIHVEDWVRAACFALEEERVAGALDATAPEPATNAEFTRVLARALGKRAPFPVPAPVLRALLGGAARVLLDSQRALPAALQRLGFAHTFPGLVSALEDLLGVDAVRFERLGAGEARESSPYLDSHEPDRRLLASTELDVPRDEAFRFFTDPDNLGLLTPRALGFETLARPEAPAAGARLLHRVRLGPLGLRWGSRFEAWDPPERFVDVQERGPYRAWWHEHRFHALGERTRMDDRVLYRMPFGPLGALAHHLFMADRLRAIFAHRALAIRLRFGPLRAP